jgi:hypothetical protein
MLAHDGKKIARSANLVAAATLWRALAKTIIEFPMT